MNKIACLLGIAALCIASGCSSNEPTQQADQPKKEQVVQKEPEKEPVVPQVQPNPIPLGLPPETTGGATDPQQLGGLPPTSFFVDDRALLASIIAQGDDPVVTVLHLHLLASRSYPGQPKLPETFGRPNFGRGLPGSSQGGSSTHNNPVFGGIAG